MTDTDFNLLVAQLGDVLSQPLRQLLNGAQANVVTIAEITNPETGVVSRVNCILVHECASAVLEGTLKGMQESERRFIEMTQNAGEASRLIVPPGRKAS